MKQLKIERTNGNVPKTAAGEDHVSGFAAYMAAGDIPQAFTEERVRPVSTLEAAERLGVTDKADAPWAVRALHHHLSELFRVNPSVSLYLGVFEGGAEHPAYAELKTLQNYSGGRIRQAAVWDPSREPSADDIVALEAAADALDEENAPLSALYFPKVTDVTKLPADLRGAGRSRVSVVIAQAGSGVGADLFASAENKDDEGNARASVTAAGVFLGLVSRAKVHQSIGWVKEFPTGVTVPAFADGTMYRDADRALLEQLDAAGYLYLRTEVGQAGSYASESHTMDPAESDYSEMESVRTMDKAVRGVRARLVPELGGNAYVDAETGRLRAYTVSHLETTAGLALEEMEKAGELSGYKVEIDPDQDVLSTGRVEVVIRQVAVGVMRKIHVRIGFAKSVG